MKILVVGGGGREHAIITSIAKSSKVTKIYCAPGNAGIAELAECVDIGVMEFDKLVDFAKKEAIDLAVVAPDDPLVAGAVDTFEAAGIRAFGPRANAAIIEGSKAFSRCTIDLCYFTGSESGSDRTCGIPCSYSGERDRCI